MFKYCISAAVLVHRSQEELGAMKRKLEKYRQREWATMSDEVLLEEVKTYRVGERGRGFYK